MSFQSVLNSKPSSVFNLDALAEAWPSPLVARDQKQLDKFSGGLLDVLPGIRSKKLC